MISLKTRNKINLKPERRNLLSLIITTIIAKRPFGVYAIETIRSKGYLNLYNETIGYKIQYPYEWERATTSGNETFFRNPKNPIESLLVEVSLPLSPKSVGLTKLGYPYDVALNYRNLYLREFMSTRLGIRRESEIISANRRLDTENKEFYDFEFVIRSFASSQQMSTTQTMGLQELEWDRTLYTTLCYANDRLYQLRVQVDTKDKEILKKQTQFIRNSFRCIEIE